MSLARRIGKSSFVYTISSALQRGATFLLLPVYTRFLNPDQYGIFAVVNVISGALLVLFTLGLHGAMTRYYFEYRREPEQLREFWGTVLTFVFLLSAGLGLLLLLFGEYILKPVTTSIPFLPYIALGIGAAIFQPVLTIFLVLLQTREEAGRFAFYNLAQFVINVSLVVSLVVFLKWGAEGPLAANLVTAAVFSPICLYALRHEYKVCLRLRYLRQALRYSLPLVPHLLSGQVMSITDRLFLNRFLSAASAGIYNVGFMVSASMNLLTDAVNKAYVPVSMDVLQSQESAQRASLKRVGMTLAILYALLATLISFFAREAISLLTTAAYHEGYAVVPYIVFGFALGGVYLIFVNILFYLSHTTRYIALGTVGGAIVNVGSNLLLIPMYGMKGAALSALASQLTTVLIIAVIGRRYEFIRWNYGQLALVYVACFSLSLAVNQIHMADPLRQLLLKVAIFTAIYLGLNQAIWGDTSYLSRRGLAVLRSLPLRAEALRF